MNILQLIIDNTIDEQLEKFSAWRNNATINNFIHIISLENINRSRITGSLDKHIDIANIFPKVFQ